MSVLEALKYSNIEARVVQPIFLSPLPIWELEKFKDQEVIVIEQSAIGQFANLLKENMNIQLKKVIKQYDGRPFDPIKLSKKIKDVL